MKREFGAKIIEEFLPRLDLTHVIDTSGAYIPGHGTPTVILFGRMQPVRDDVIRVVLGIRGEPQTPLNPAMGLVWTSIVQLIDKPGSESDWVTSADLQRIIYSRHPWSLQGGAAPAVLETVEAAATHRLGSVVAGIGFGAITGDDDVFVVPKHYYARVGQSLERRELVAGDNVRDWSIESLDIVLFPLTLTKLGRAPGFLRHVWRNRCVLTNTLYFGKNKEQRNIRWFDFVYWSESKLGGSSIVLAFVATHNHFVLDRGGKVCKQSAPVIKLPADATEDDHLGLLGLLNSSTACFWLQQVCHSKGGPGGARSKDEKWHDFYEFTGTALQNFPVPSARPIELARLLDSLAQGRSEMQPESILGANLPTKDQLVQTSEADAVAYENMVALQEELDWWSYRAYGLTQLNLAYDDKLPQVCPGERAFEIALARRQHEGEISTAWFSRTPAIATTTIPDRWPATYRDLVARRIELIESDRFIRLLEQPEYKRRWNQESWELREQRALRSWLLDRLESDRYWGQPVLRTARQLAEQAATDEGFVQVAELYVGQAGFEVSPLIAKLLEEENVPAMAALRYKAPGLRKRAVWERTWELQRDEDRIDAEVAETLPRPEDETDEEYAVRLKVAQDKHKKEEIGDIHAPPKYKSADFISSTVWRQRGPLDVPKERFFSLPYGSPSADGSLLVGWAGWNSLQRAQAIAARLADADNEGWSAEQMVPLLMALRELLPWIKQWHNDIDPEYGQRMGDVFEGFLAAELQRQGLTDQELVEWKPASTRRKRKRKVNKKTT